MRSEPGAARVQGFVLALTLWLLAGIAVVVAVLAHWSLQQVREAAASKARLEARAAMIGTRDTLLYVLATTGKTRAGLPMQRPPDEALAARRLDDMGGLSVEPFGSELRLDGTVYAGLEGIAFAVQDESGLFSVSWPSDRRLDAFLMAHGIDPQQIPVLRDQLLDYIDRDDLTRLHGAEADDYRRAGLPPPANRRLLQPQELARVPAWRALPDEQLQRLIAQSTATYSGAFNLNTAPRELLPMFIHGCPETCDTLIALRERVPFRSGPELELRVGVRLPGDSAVDYRFAPSDDLRLTLWSETGAAWRIHVRLTPLANQRAPWIISSAYTVPRPAAHEPPRPTGSPLFADAPPDRR
ncbi:MAG: general secretion pathway protein GspK [Rehaibacterium terrae]|uniref:general secretion pathway protein GspK n=1 Tax=Rehaibacterium terrae TaxID=1341696 RepID=UPI003918A1C1